MSQYIHFFTRVNNLFVPISTFPRDSAIYHVFSAAPYEKIEKLTLDDIKRATDALENDCHYWDEQLQKNERRKNIIATFNNTAEEKLNAIEECEQEHQNLMQFADEAQYGLSFCEFLLDMLDEFEDYTEHQKDKTDTYPELYYGVEIGYPTVDDIKED